MINKFLIKKLVKNSLKIAIFAIILVLKFSIDVFALSKNNYERYIEDGYLGMSNVDFTINAKGQMYRKFGHFIIDGEYTGGDKTNPFYNDANSRDLAIEAADGDSTYDVYAELDDEDIDYSYEDDEELTATDYDRAAFQARIDAMVYGNTYHGALGYGKYNLRPGKNLTAFIKFAYDFYKNVSGDPKVGCKNEFDLQAKGITDGKICPMEYLETYANANYISAECVDGNFKNVWKACTKYWNYEGSTLETTENIFEHLQDIFMAYVYLKPGYRKIRSHVNTEDINETDMCAILSMMYERFGGRPINPSKVESGDAIPRIGTADILPALIEYPDMSIADKIYTYMIEVKYKNSDLKLASWLKEYEDVMGYEYTILDSDDYDNFMKAYQVAFQKYGQDSANDTLLDYGFVLTPDIFESKISYTQALNKFANTIRSHFGNSSFYNNRNNANFVAKSYAMAKKMCENSAFCDITDIYACDMDVVSHTVGYPNKNIILLADTQVVELNDDYGADCDTDYDGINDNREAHTPEEVDISSFVREYCKYNEYSQAETEEMLANNSKVIMYNYSSNPVLPDTDFDGRSDLVDGLKLDNEYNSVNETNNYSNIKIKFSQDYRYFFMDSTKYYEDLAEMGLILSNMMCRKNGHEKTWKNNNTGEQYSLTGIREYMRYIGMDQVEEHIVSDLSTNEQYDVPYILGQHDCIGILGKVNNLERNIITLCIGENERYKDILAANYDGKLGNAGSDDTHHMGYDFYADEILQDLIEYDNNQSGSRWNKSYWITGYGTGGAVANLVAKKFIDYKHVNTNIYCYTYQAPGTINRNNIKSERGIINTKYYNIFNLINTDDPYMYLESDDFDRYGRDKLVEAGFSSNLKLIKNNYLYNEQHGLVNKMLLQNDIDRDMVVAFSFSFDSFVKLITDGVDKLKTLVKVISLSFTPRTEVIKDADNNGEHDEGVLATTIYDKYNSSTASAKDAKYQLKVVEKQKNVNDKMYIPPNNIDSSAKLLPYIENMAKYYVNYIATYQGSKQLSNGKIRATDNASLYYDYLNMHKNTKPFDVYNNDNYEYDDILKINKFKNDLKYLSDNEKAVQSLTGKKIYYYSDFSKLSTSISNGVFYDWSSGEKVEKTKDFNSYSHYIGDDCTGFSQAVIFEIERNKAENKNKENIEPRGMNGIAGECYGLYNHNEYGETYLGSKTSDVKDRFRNTEIALQNLGYKRYDASTKTIDWLKPGDLLCSKKHVEFYVGNDYCVTFNESNKTNRNDKKKAGIENIIHNGELTKTRKNIKQVNGDYVFEEIIQGGKTLPAAQGTFGWGGVNDEFPVENSGQEMTFFKKSSDDKYFELYESWNKTDGNQYTTIWRYER